MSPRTGARRRLGSIRLSLILLALVPGVTLATMWGMTTTQMFDGGATAARADGAEQVDRRHGHRRDARAAEGAQSVGGLAGRPARLPGRPGGAARRRPTRRSPSWSASPTRSSKAPARIADRLYSVLGSVGSLEYYRGQVDDPTDITAEQALDQYTLDHRRPDPRLPGALPGRRRRPHLAGRPAGRPGARGGAGLPGGRAAHPGLAVRASGREGLERSSPSWSTPGAGSSRTRSSPRCSGSRQDADRARFCRARSGRPWRPSRTRCSRSGRPATDGRVALPDEQKRVERRTDKVADRVRGADPAADVRTARPQRRQGDNLLLTAASLSAGGLVALLLCVVMSWRITRSLSRRLRGLKRPP